MTDDVRALLERGTRGFEPTVDAIGGTMRRVRRRRTKRQAVQGVLGVAVVVVVGAGAVRLLAGGSAADQAAGDGSAGAPAASGPSEERCTDEAFGISVIVPAGWLPVSADACDAFDPEPPPPDVDAAGRPPGLVLRVLDPGLSEAVDGYVRDERIRVSERRRTDVPAGPTVIVAGTAEGVSGSDGRIASFVDVGDRVVLVEGTWVRAAPFSRADLAGIVREVAASLKIV